MEQKGLMKYFNKITSENQKDGVAKKSIPEPQEKELRKENNLQQETENINSGFDKRISKRFRKFV